MSSATTATQSLTIEEKAWRWSLLLIICNGLLWFLLFSYYRHGLDNADMIEAYAWGHTWDWGNNKHPPMTGWVTNLWFSFFPTNDDAFYLLTEFNLGLALYFLALAMKRFMHGYQLLFALFLTILFSRYGFDTGYKYNANSGQLPFITGFLWASVRALCDKQPRSAWWWLVGVFAAAAILCKYSAAVLLIASAAGLILMLKPDLKRLVYGCVVTIITASILIAPHILWEVRHHWPSIHYMHESHEFLAKDSEWTELIHAFIGLIRFAAIPILFLVIATFKLKNFEHVHHRRKRAGLLIYVLMILLTLLAASLENITIEATWFIVPSIFLGWFLVDLVPQDIDWRRVGLRSRNLFFIYIGLLIISAVYVENRYDNYPAPAAYALKQQLAQDVTHLYQATFHQKIQNVAGTFPLPYALAFYSSDHPQGLYGLDLADSPWINRTKLKKQSKVVVCSAQKSDDCINTAYQLFGRPSRRAILNYSSYDSSHKRCEIEHFTVLMYPRRHTSTVTAMSRHALNLKSSG